MDKDWFGESRCDLERAPDDAYALWERLLDEADRAVAGAPLTSGLHPEAPIWLLGEMARELRFLVARERERAARTAPAGR